MATKSAGKKIVDIAHPGASAPTSTAKPVLVSNRPIMHDPMVVKDDAESAPQIKGTSSIKVKLQPLADSDLATDKKDEPAEAAPAEVQTATPEAPKPEPSKAEEPSETAGSEPKRRSDDATKDPDAEAKEAEAAAARDAALQQLVDSKKYFLPIETQEKRRSKQTLAIGLVVSILLALAWLDIALDAGLIHLGGIKALTNFFSS